MAYLSVRHARLSLDQMDKEISSRTFPPLISFPPLRQNASKQWLRSRQPDNADLDPYGGRLLLCEKFLLSTSPPPHL
jgi:hypothetical protein